MAEGKGEIDSSSSQPPCRPGSGNWRPGPSPCASTLNTMLVLAVIAIAMMATKVESSRNVVGIDGAIAMTVVAGKGYEL